MRCSDDDYRIRIVDGGRGGRFVESRRFRKRRSYMLAVVEEGALDARSAGGWFSFPAPCGLFLPPRRFSEVILSAASRAKYVIFNVVPDDGVSKQPGMREVWGANLKELISPVALPMCQQALTFVSELWWRGAYNRLRAEARLAEWIALFFCSNVQEEFTGCGGEVGRWLEQGHEQLPRGFTVEQWAKVNGMSRVLFSRKFKASIGESPGTWLASRRLERAQKLLLEEATSVGSVGYRCGFNSAEAFSRFFRAKTGVPPGEWRTHRQWSA